MRLEGISRLEEYCSSRETNPFGSGASATGRQDAACAAYADSASIGDLRRLGCGREDAACAADTEPAGVGDLRGLCCRRAGKAVHDGGGKLSLDEGQEMGSLVGW